MAVITAMLFPASVLAQTESDTGRVEEVVVTALGIKKEKKKLGYAVQEIQGTDLIKQLGRSCCGFDYRTKCGIVGYTSDCVAR